MGWKTMARESVEGLMDLGKALGEGSKYFLLMLLRKALGNVMEAELTDRCRAESGERSPFVGEQPERLPGQRSGNAPGDRGP